jgi:AcrR family transcriptional regulator
VTADEAPTTPAATATRRELAVARGLDQARSRAENRVELFLDAARELIDEKAGDFTVQEVVARSGQSLRTFYQYFGGKHELLLALFEESIRAAAGHLEEVVAAVDDPLGRVRCFTVEYFLMCRRSPNARPTTVRAAAMVEFAQELLTSYPQESARAFAPLVDLLDGLLADAQASGFVRPDLDHRRLAGMLLQATMFDAFAVGISGLPPGPDASDADAHWSVLARGIEP